MPNIRYVCLSDLHLGEEDSLLTNIDEAGRVDTVSPSPVLLRLTDCLAELLKRNDASATKPTLILNGDLLELALSTDEKAALTFALFMARVMPPDEPLFGEIVFLPGNHDHHLWETAREAQYLNYMRRLTADATLEPPWHTTKLFMDMEGEDRLVHGFLTTVARHLVPLRDVEVLTAYPSYGVLAADGDRCVVFHHGHYIESLYHLMSTIASLVFPENRPPRVIYELEEENFAWIDFFWSAMGRQGKVGEEIEHVYETTCDQQSLLHVASTTARSIAHKYDLPLLWGDWLEELVLKKILRQIAKRVAGKQERQQTDHAMDRPPLSEDSLAGLRQYMTLLREQGRQENSPLTESVTLVFGHTHKPFQALMDFAEYPRPVSVLNTGGWLVESIEPEPLHGGAIALIDDGLNTVNLRLYHEGRYDVQVEEPLWPGSEHSALWEQINQIVNADLDPWRSFGLTVSAEIMRREEFLKSRARRRTWR